MKGTIGNFSVMEKVMKGAEKDYQGRQVEKEQRLMVGAVMLVGRGSYAQKTSFQLHVPQNFALPTDGPLDGLKPTKKALLLLATLGVVLGKGTSHSFSNTHKSHLQWKTKTNRK